LKRSGGTDPEEALVELSEPVLRAKYLDYCSARVADLLLRLTADEMYLLAQEAAGELDADDSESLSYTEIVRLATDRMARKLSLPDYRNWVRAYRSDPEAFDRELLGLWESDIGSRDPAAP